MTALTVQQRAVGAIVGSIIADAAGATTHWIYDVAKLDAVLDLHPHPEFLHPTQCPFYKLPTGHNSCYGDQVFVVLQSLEACKGFDKDDYKKRVYETFGPQSEYAGDLGHDPTRGDIPINFPWRNGSLRHFLTEYEAGNQATGKDDPQADGLAKISPIVALYAGHPQLETVVREVVKVTQDNELALATAVAAAKILEQYILHGPAADTVEKIAGELDSTLLPHVNAALEAKDSEHREAVKKFGSSCALPGSFRSALHAVITSGEDFAQTTRVTMTAGGDNCSRLCYTGAVMGASVGIAGLPQDWISKTSHGQEAVSLAESLVASRSQ